MPRLRRIKSAASLKTVKSFRTLRSFRSLKRRKHERHDTFNLQPNCRLLQLPPEIRNEIYSLILTSQNQKQKYQLQSLTFPPLLFTCRQILIEALPLFFASNRFTFVIRFTNHRLVKPLIDPSTWRLRRIISNSGATAGPMIDYEIDQRDHNGSRALTTLEVRKGRTQWIYGTAWIAKEKGAVLRAWPLPILEEGPTFEEVMAVAEYVARSNTPSVWQKIFGRVALKIFKTMDEQDRSWGRV